MLLGKYSNLSSHVCKKKWLGEEVKKAVCGRLPCPSIFHWITQQKGKWKESFFWMVYLNGNNFTFMCHKVVVHENHARNAWCTHGRAPWRKDHKGHIE